MWWAQVLLSGEELAGLDDEVERVITHRWGKGDKQNGAFLSVSFTLRWWAPFVGWVGLNLNLVGPRAVERGGEELVGWGDEVARVITHRWGRGDEPKGAFFLNV